MSRHTVENLHEARKFVFGWDPPLQSFFLQVHALDKPEEDDQIIVWIGSDSETSMYEIEDFIRKAREHGLTVNNDLRRTLYTDREEDR